MLTYKSQNMTNLRFYLLDSDSISDTVQILKQKRLRFPNYQLDLRIIGSSHIISLRTVSTQLMEGLTCLPMKDIEAKALVECLLPLSGGFTTTVGDVQHTITFHTSWFEQDEYRKRHHLLLKTTNETLQYEFPVREGTDNLNPLTLLKYSCRAKLAQIWTYHTYPDECGIANTHTKIEILNNGSVKGELFGKIQPII